MKHFLSIIISSVISVNTASQAHARILECSFDYASHLTTFTIEEGRNSADLFVSFEHSISPTGGEEMYLFRDTEESRLTGNSNWHHIYGKLFQAEDFPSIQMVDFEQAQLIEVQFLEHGMVNNRPVQYLHWDCRRLD